MNYAEIRSDIKSGDLLAFQHGSWKSWKEIKTLAVRVFTASTFSHVGIAWVTSGRVFVLEAVTTGVRIFPLSLSGDFYLIPLKAPWFSVTEEYALSKIGFPYSELKAIYAALYELKRGEVSECAAYAREIMYRDGIDLGSMSRPDTVVLTAQERYGAPCMFIKNDRPL